MKKIYFILLLSFLSINSFSQVSWQGGLTPEANQTGTILFDKTGTGLSAYTGTIYAHTGVTLNGTTWSNTIGTWGNNTTQPALTLVSGNIYKLDLTPTIQSFYSVAAGTITKINIVFRSADGTQQSVDLQLNIGAFQATLVSPIENSNTIISSGQNLAISANNINGNANYNLLANGTSINTSTGTNYSFTDLNITTNKSYELQITQGLTVFSKKFNVVVNPGTTSLAMVGGLDDGINYNSGDATKATLVLDAPGKDFVYVAGSFNNYQPNTSYAMKKDPTTGKFWLELTGLTSGVNYNYQYWVVDTTPIANSPSLVKTADPYSTLVLSPTDDPYIPAASYPNIPSYPIGQDREVTVLQTGQTAYSWVNTNFSKPKKEDLVIYEVLVRDFDANRNFQDLINKISYFKNLKINAIELLPVMEFEGNESWGYNTSFHMALDKFYGTSNKFKELIDLCHTNGIAVILDVALNHAFGRNPMNRMWMNDPDGDGWGDPSTENPYFNTVAKHSYSVGSDFNHASLLTKNYTKRVIKQWIQEYKIDGFRWDLTKGFTQACSAGDDACTNAYQADRVAILKDYADYSWSLDPTHYTIFEHLGTDSEEQQWANYRIGETPSKGVMLWGKMSDEYATLSKGFNGDIARVGNSSRGFTNRRLVGYAESHDEERTMYRTITEGNTAGQSARILNNALKRMSTMAAMHLLVPGPKMIWHFGELGWDSSIFTCNNGTINNQVDPTPGDCKLDKKPQPQWANNWLADANRSIVYNDWAKLNTLKINEPVFEGNYTISPDGAASNVRQRMYIWDDALPVNSLKNVVVISNFSVAALNIIPNFPYVGTWYNLMDNSSINVTNTTATLNIPAGEFRIYGNQLAPSLANNEFELTKSISLYPNPTNNIFSLTHLASNVQIYNITGQLVKNFKGSFDTNHLYSIDDLKQGIYLVKITDDNNRQTTIKLVKE
jgi:1,4-alpha-glucan branching enzyme